MKKLYILVGLTLILSIILTGLVLSPNVIKGQTADIVQLENLSGEMVFNTPITSTAENSVYTFILLDKTENSLEMIGYTDYKKFNHEYNKIKSNLIEFERTDLTLSQSFKNKIDSFEFG